MEYAQIFDDPIFIETTFVFIVVLLIALYQKLFKVMIALIGVYIVYIGIILINQEKQVRSVIQPNEVKTESIVVEKPEPIEEVQSETLTAESEIPVIAEEKIEQNSDGKGNNNKPETVLQKPAIIKSPLEMTKIVICRNVLSESRKAIDPANKFPNNVNRLYCFSTIRNMNRPQEIRHVWYFQDKMISSVSMIVGWSYNWRTWSYQTILPQNTGNWSVAVLDTMNQEIGRVHFSVLPDTSFIP